MFHNFMSAIVDPTEKAVSIPYLTVWRIGDLNLVSFLRVYGFSTIRKISFITSGAIFIFTLKILTANFCRLDGEF